MRQFVVWYGTRKLAELRESRLPPPARSAGQGRRRRMSVASSQGSRAVHAGSGHDYLSERASRCHSALDHFSLEPELWVSTNRSSAAHSDLLNDVNMAPSTLNTRQRVWSEAGRSCDETTIRASLRKYPTSSDYLIPGSRQASTRRLTSEEQSEVEDLMNMSFSDTLLHNSSFMSYEKLTSRKEKKRRSGRDQGGYHCYDNPSSLNDEFNGL
ncbi:uncharacterized protein TNCV_175921 [Trichonephila clavipes]|nr:uncharacterized protein TNCV_175921 [Trichonephila clavipes]